MTNLIRAYWRVPRWLRYVSLVILSAGAGAVLDSFSPVHHSVNIVFIVVVLVIWGTAINADRRRGQQGT